MKLRNVLTSAICAALAAQAFAQTTPAPSLASSAGVMAYPAKGQDAATQSKDESECFNWAKQQSGFDPDVAAADRHGRRRTSAAAASLRLARTRRGAWCCRRCRGRRSRQQ